MKNKGKGKTGSPDDWESSISRIPNNMTDHDKIGLIIENMYELEK